MYSTYIARRGMSLLVADLLNKHSTLGTLHTYTHQYRCILYMKPKAVALDPIREWSEHLIVLYSMIYSQVKSA